MIIRPYLSLPILMSAVLLGGCSTQPSQKTLFYRLDLPVASAQQTTEPTKTVSAQPLIGIGPVTLANYLDRPQIIRRLSPYQLELDDFHHWAGKLQDNITLVLVDALQSNLGADKVVGYPWHRAVKPAYELSLNVDRLDAQQEQLLLQVRWTLIDGREGRLIDLHQANITEPVQGSGAEAQVAAASRAVKRLAEQLTARLRPYL